MKNKINKLINKTTIHDGERGKEGLLYLKNFESGEW